MYVDRCVYTNVDAIISLFMFSFILIYDRVALTNVFIMF